LEAARLIGRRGTEDTVPRDFGNGDRTPEYTYPVIVGVDGSFAAIRAA